MKLLISSDHRGFAFKKYIIDQFSENHEIIDCGTYSDAAVDYPDYAHKLCNQIHENAMGILICGSGIGMSIVANRYPNIRAALCRNKQDAISSREHNDANIIVIGSDNLNFDEGVEMITSFLSTDFSGGRHQKRIEKINLKSEV